MVNIRKQAVNRTVVSEVSSFVDNLVYKNQRLTNYVQLEPLPSSMKHKV